MRIWIRKFVACACPAFRDPRYLRSGGRPILVTRGWDSVTRGAESDELFLLQSEPAEGGDPRPRGFDAAVETPQTTLPSSYPRSNGAWT